MITEANRIKSVDMPKTIIEKLGFIQSNLIVPKSQFNSFGKYNYRSCEDILEALKPLLKQMEVTLTINDEVVLIGDRFYVKATAILSDTQSTIQTSGYARESADKKGMDDSQITGATSSYARKYALNGLFCIDDTKDSDSTNNHDKQAVKPQETPNSVPTQEKSLKEMVLDKATKLFKTKDDFKIWLTDNALIEDLNKATNFDLSKILLAVQELEKKVSK